MSKQSLLARGDGTLATLATLALLLLTLGGCATRYPSKPEDQATYHAHAAVENFDRRTYAAAEGHIRDALRLPSGVEQIREVFAKDPEMAKMYYTYLQSTISRASSGSYAAEAKQQLEAAQPLYSASQNATLQRELSDKVTTGNLDGTVPFTFDDRYQDFPSLQTPQQQAKIMENTLEWLRSGRSPRPIAPLLAYVQKVGVSSPQGEAVRAALPSLLIKRDEISQIARLYPDFAREAEIATTALVLITFEPPDRLLHDDLMKVLRSTLKGIEYTKAVGPGTVQIIVERLRLVESQIPARTETVTYSQVDVNLVAAALLMPRNSSYLVDVTTSGAEIDFGFAVKASQGGKPLSDEVVRDQISRKTVTCSNARVQNVFGGVQPAAFVANDDMARRCNASSGAAKLDDLRAEMLQRIANEIAKVAPIERVQRLN